LVLEASLNLDAYGLDGAARVFVEAYRHAQYKRFDFGTVSALRAPDDRSLSEFGVADGILFRVKVVSFSAEVKGLILAQADQIRPRSADHRPDQIPLLPVTPDEDLGDEVWRLDFGDQETSLRVNSSFVDWRGLVCDPAFEALVLPCILRTVITHICLNEQHRDTEDADDWRSRWLRFACSLTSNPPPPGDEDAQERWINDVVQRFCRKHHLLAKARPLLDGGR
jgi:hypothetical protein